MWYALAVLATIVLVAVNWKKYFESKTETLHVTKLLWDGGKFFVVTMAAATALTAIVIIDAGHRGVVFSRITGVRATPIGEGLNFVAPYVNYVVEMDVRTTKENFKTSAASKDLQIVTTELALNYHPVAATVSSIYQRVGLAYTERIIKPAVNEVVKAQTAKYTAEELITKRENVKNAIRVSITELLAKSDIEVVNVFITDFQFSKAFSEAIEAKQVAEQRAAEAKNKLVQIKIEAEQKIATARAQAESLRMQKQQVTPELIQLRVAEVMKDAVAKWDGSFPQVMAGGDLPFLMKLDPSQFPKKKKSAEQK